MLAEERRAILHSKLREDGYVQVTELADEIRYLLRDHQA